MPSLGLESPLIDVANESGQSLLGKIKRDMAKLDLISVDPAAIASLTAQAASVQENMALLNADNAALKSRTFSLPKKVSKLPGGNFDPLVTSYFNSFNWSANLAPVVDTYLNGLGFNHVLPYTNTPNVSVLTLPILDTIRTTKFILSQLFYSPSAVPPVITGANIIISYKDNLNAYVYIRYNTAGVKTTTKQLSTNVWVVSSEIPAQPNIGTPAQTTLQSLNLYCNNNVVDGAMVNPSIFIFDAAASFSIHTCDYTGTVIDKTVDTSLSTLKYALTAVDLLTRQNAAMKNAWNGTNFTRKGMNLMRPRYWESTEPFIDLMKSSADYWINNTTGAVDATWNDARGWLTSLPAGQAMKKYVKIHGEDYAHKKGSYVLTWTGPCDCTVVSVLGQNANIVTDPAGNRVTFDTLDLTGVATPTPITIIVTNNTATAINVTDIKVFRLQNEPDLIAGEIFCADWLLYHSDVEVIRFMDWLDTNNSTVVNFSDMHIESDCSWGLENGILAIPPSIIGKLGSKLGIDLWINMPHLATAACMTAIATDISNNYPNGVVYVEFSNEMWNNLFTQAVWAGNTNPAGVVGSYLDKQNAGTAKASIEAWSACENVFGTARVKRVICTQSVAIAGRMSMLSYIHPTLYAGAKLGSILDLFGQAPYFTLTGGSGISSPISQLELMEQQAYLRSDTWWEPELTAAVKTKANDMLSNTAIVKAVVGVNPNIRITSYEAGHHLQTSAADAVYTMVIDDINNAFIVGAAGYDTVAAINADLAPADAIIKYVYYDAVATNNGRYKKVGATGLGTWVQLDNSSMFSSGENLVLGFAVVFPFVGSNHYTEYPISVVAGKGDGKFRIQVYATQADYPATPATLVASATAGPQKCDNRTRLIALGDKYKTLMNTPWFADLYMQYIYDVFRTTGMETYNQFIDIGWSTGSLNFTWGSTPRIDVQTNVSAGLLALYKKYPNGLPPGIPNV